MVRYVGRLGKGTLYPKDLEQQRRVDEVFELSNDYYRDFSPAIYINMRP